MSTYEQLQKVCADLLNRQENGSITDSEVSTVRPMIEELKDFVQDISRRQNVSTGIKQVKGKFTTVSKKLDGQGKRLT